MKFEMTAIFAAMALIGCQSSMGGPPPMGAPPRAGMAMNQGPAGGMPPTRNHTATTAKTVELEPATVSLDLASQSVFEVSGNKRIVKSNAIPDHRVGTFPNSGNPNRISPQNQNFQMPLEGERASRTTSVQGRIFGIGLNGVVFDPFAGEFWQGNPRSGWNYDAHGGAVALGLDANHAHVQPTGTYHYHGTPSGLIANDADYGTDGVLLIGYAADGFPIYVGSINGVAARSSYRLKSGQRPGGEEPSGAYDGAFVEDYAYTAGVGNLDACNGAQITSAEYPEGVYAYFITEEFPNVPRCFVGTADPSFSHRRGR